jgi:hypothetical protein
MMRTNSRNYFERILNLILVVLAKTEGKSYFEAEKMYKNYLKTSKIISNY